MHIRKLDTANPRDVKQFSLFPFELYKNSALWVPPFISDVRFAMDRDKHPFYQHSFADFFVAEHNGKTQARVAILEKTKYNQFHNEKAAFFYFYEAVNDLEITKALFETAAEWAKSRGLTTILGPFGFIQGDSIGLLVDGFEHRPAMGQTYNFDYYDDLLKQCGFVKKSDFYSGYLSASAELPQRFYTIADKVKAKRNFWIKSFHNKAELREWIARIQELYNAAFSNNFGYTPLSQKEAEIVANRMLAISNPRLIKLVMKNDEIIGFLFAFVDVTDGLRKAGGHMWPFGWWPILREFKQTRWVNFNGTGLLPGHRGVGANAVLYTEMAKTIKQFNFLHADLVQVEENNAKSLGDMQAMGVQWYKTHRVYERTL